jgi:hypothetical protein
VNCDFCHAVREHLFISRAQDRMVGEMRDGTIVLDDGGWGACEECEALIRARDFQGLIDRSASSFLDRHPEIPMEFALLRIRQIVNGVFGLDSAA